MKPKNLQEFIEQNNYHNHISEFLVMKTAKHLLEVARKWCNMEEDTAENLYSYLESYCAPVEDLKK